MRLTAAIVLLATALLVSSAKPAACTYCPDFACYSSTDCGGGDCKCLGGTTDADPGVCVQVR